MPGQGDVDAGVRRCQSVLGDTPAGVRSSVDRPPEADPDTITSRTPYD